MNGYLQDAIKHIKAAGYHFEEQDTMENDRFRIVFEVTKPSEWNTELTLHCYSKSTGNEEPCALFPAEAKIEHNLLRAVREDLPKRHTAEDCMEQISESLRLIRRAVSGITNAALLTDNADGLFLAVWSEQDCIYLADFSGNPDEAGRCFADLYTGRANKNIVCFWWEEGDFASDLAQLWGTDGSQAEVTCEHRRRIIEGWEGEMEGTLKCLAPLTAGGGSKWRLDDCTKRAITAESNTQLQNALCAARCDGYPVKD